MSVLGEEMQTLHLVCDTTPATPLPALRAMTALALQRQPFSLIVLLTRAFDGPTCHRTLSPLRRSHRLESYYRFRLDDCAFGDCRLLDIDLADVVDQRERRDAILEIVPTSASLICGRRAMSR